MTTRNQHERMTHDDVFFSLVLLGMGLYFSYEAWAAAEWGRFAGTVVMALFGGIWLAIRIYHLTHKDEVFGQHE